MSYKMCVSFETLLSVQIGVSFMWSKPLSQDSGVAAVNVRTQEANSRTQESGVAHAALLACELGMPTGGLSRRTPLLPCQA